MHTMSLAEEFIKNDSGVITEVICSYDPETKEEIQQMDEKLKAQSNGLTLNFNSNKSKTLRQTLFKTKSEECADGEDFINNLNNDSLKILDGCMTECNLDQIETGIPFQLERIGYFCKDQDSDVENEFILNRTVALRDSWSKNNKNQ